MEKLSRNRLFPFHSVRCLKYFDLYGGNNPIRPERAEAPSPGRRPGYLWMQTCRPVWAKAFKDQAIYKAFAFTGCLVDCH